MDVLLLRTLASMGMCLPSRCLAMGLYVTVFLSLFSNVAQIEVQQNKRVRNIR
jgi:hypothetical protein